MHNCPNFELGTPGPMRDKLIQAVLNGKKTATSSLLSVWTQTGKALPNVGDRFTLIDSDSNSVALVEITGVEIKPLNEITDAIVEAEGEDFSDVNEWRRTHEAFWLEDKYASDHEGWQLPDNTQVVVEYFKLIEEAR